MHARIRAISRYLPEHTLTNEELSLLFPAWSVEKIASKTGIHNRHIASDGEYSSDLAIRACENLLSDYAIHANLFDFLIVVTQTPDFLLPGISSFVHKSLGMRGNSGAIDVNQGCSGYIYGLSLAKGLIDSGIASNVLLVTSDTYSKLLNPGDKSVRTLFGDGATATWVDNQGNENSLSGFVFGTDGEGAGSLMVPRGALRSGEVMFPKTDINSRELVRSEFDLYMDGPAIFNFTLRVVAKTITEVLEKSGRLESETDLFVLHQANAFVLSHIRDKMRIDPERLPILMGEWGNTVSSTIPMALYELRNQKRVGGGQKLILVGFGVGLSWAGVSAIGDW